ncbi:fimbria/pilus outer membrane usher protein [Pseudomonas sp. S32]|uniref:fimbria/pilus outer membrane usher protein n=1 Tax=Pseudomonas sp. S32 TaxID=2767448 RepID=UPI001913F9AC|nr:fimbria/pilus outer membrane usher protein [Pseudomonas sp. S32]MBK5008054.1 fimbrial biogenesis outer membrane usher protein [Pseudomonas sp. S32]
MLLRSIRRFTPPCPFAPLLALAGGSLLLSAPRPACANQPDLHFNSSFMRQAPDQPTDAGATALQALAAEAPLSPGHYRVEVSVNHDYLGQRSVELVKPAEGKGLQACLSAALLREVGLREEGLATALSDEQCINLDSLVADARTDFDSRTLRLMLSIPQIALRRDIVGSVPPEQWSSGISAAFLNYQASMQTRNQRGASSTNHDLLVHSGLNIGAWRVRSSQALRDTGDGKSRWTHSNTYAQRDLPDNRGNITFGETLSNGEVFRSQPFKGVQLASDMGMLPDTFQSYAPVIRGVAQTRAKLEILQNGYPVYSTYVAAGPYAIDDLSIGTGSGELEVVLTEADGQVRRFIQPYSSMANLLRPGIWRYSATLGRYNGAGRHDDPLLWQSTLARGGAWDSTLYGGLQGGDFYKAGTLGVSKDLGSLGALSLDATHARTDLGRSLGEVQGQSFSARYGKIFQTGTNLRFAGYRYSTEGYRDYDEAVRERAADSRYLGNRRSRVEASAQQSIGTGSSLSLTLSQDDYWRNNLRRRQYQLQFNTQWRKVNYNFFASQALGAQGKEDRLIGLSITLPLDFAHMGHASFDVQSAGGKQRQRASLNASALDNQLHYAISADRDARNNSSGALSMGYQNAYASYGAGYTQGGNFRSLSANVSGSLLLHEDGLTFGNYLGETNALVHVPGVSNIGTRNAPNATTDSRGYMLVPHLRPYRRNALLLDTDGVGPEVEIDQGSANLVPRRGAIVKAAFAARRVARVILTLQHPEGRPLPFGAQVSNAQGQPLAVVGQAGQALLAIDETPQQLQVRWGEQAQHTCQLTIDPVNIPSNHGYRTHSALCL